MRRACSKSSLRRLTVIVALLCVALGFLRHAVKSWGPGEVTTMALTILLATNVLAWFQTARRQVFWVGFGIFGWAYLMISLGSPAGEHLPTTWLLVGLHDRLHSTPEAPTFGDLDDDNDGVGPVHAYRFRRSGQSVLSLVFAMLGGVGALVLFPAGCKDREEPRPRDGSLLMPGWREK